MTANLNTMRTAPTNHQTAQMMHRMRDWSLGSQQKSNVASTPSFSYSSSAGISSQTSAHSTSTITNNNNNNRRILDYAPSSNWSNASTEQSFDAQATMHVRDMLEKLEMYMYNESKSLFANSAQLSAECEEWAQFFPHIRVRGHNQSPQKDLGHEHIPHRSSVSGNSRACVVSPYFYMPQTRATNLQMDGIQLPRDAVVRKPLALDSREFIEGFGLGGVQSLLDWNSCGVIDGFLQNGLHSEIKSATPTSHDPHSTRFSDYHVSPNSIQLKILASSKTNKSHMGASSSLKSLRNALPTASTSEDAIGDSTIFGLALVEWNDLQNEAPCCNSDFILSEGEDKSVLVFVHWDNADVLKNEEDKRNKTSQKSYEITSFDVMFAFQTADWAIYEIHASLLYDFIQSSPKSLNIHLICKESKIVSSNANEEIFAIDGEIEEYFALDDDLEEDFEKSSPTYSRSFQRRGLPPITPNASIRQDIMSNVFDDIWSEVIPLFQPLLSKGCEPSIANSKKQSQQQNILTNSLTNSHQDVFDGLNPTKQPDSQLFEVFGDPEASDDIFSANTQTLLSSAMTIKSLPLQRRDSSARVKTFSLENISTLESANNFGIGISSSRPSSAHRATSSRPNLNSTTRPASGKNYELYLCQQQQQQQANHNRSTNPNTSLSNASTGGITSSPSSSSHIKTSPSRSAMKRGSTGMRLTPLSSGVMPPIGNTNMQQAQGMNDVLFGTSIGVGNSGGGGNNGRPSTSYGERAVTGSTTAKRLPPIKMSAYPIQEGMEGLNFVNSPKNVK
ncbi:hypothetical protein HK100_006494, partial [Physocladia obscura]